MQADPWCRLCCASDHANCPSLQTALRLSREYYTRVLAKRMLKQHRVLGCRESPTHHEGTRSLHLKVEGPKLARLIAQGLEGDAPMRRLWPRECEGLDAAGGLLDPHAPHKAGVGIWHGVVGGELHFPSGPHWQAPSQPCPGIQLEMDRALRSWQAPVLQIHVCTACPSRRVDFTLKLKLVFSVKREL